MEEAANVLFRIGPLEVTSTVTTMWAIIAVLGLISFLATRNLKEIPGPLQSGVQRSDGLGLRHVMHIQLRKGALVQIQSHASSPI